MPDFTDDLPTRKISDPDLFLVGLCQCGEPTAVNMVSAVNTFTGENKTGAASEFSQIDKNLNPTWQLKPGWSVQRIEGFCTTCYYQTQPKRPRKYSDDQVRMAWRWLMGERTKDASNKALAHVYPRIKVTDEQRDQFIEIVNYEAWRTNQPEALPDRFTLDTVWR